MADQIQPLVQLLQASLDPRQQKQGKHPNSAFSSKVGGHCPFLEKQRASQRNNADNLTAETAIREEEHSPGFSLVLLNIVNSDSLPLDRARLPAAIYFKNFISRNWTVCGQAISLSSADANQDEDGHYKLPEAEVAAIKNELIGLMISVPPKLQSQLGEAVSVIADSDFWTRWNTLVDVR